MNNAEGNAQEMFGFSVPLLVIKELLCIVPLFLFFYFSIKHSPDGVIPPSHRITALFLMVAAQLLLFRRFLNFTTLEEDALVCRQYDLILVWKSAVVKLGFRQIVKTEIHQASWQRLLGIGGNVTLFTLMPEHKEILIRNVKDPQRLVDLIQARKQSD